MKLIVGLGNPGREYDNSRHNVGFEVVDELSQSWTIDVNQHKFHAAFGQGLVKFEKVLLLKPLTYMNRSGGSVLEAIQFFKIDLDDVLIIVDDMALELGQLRFRAKGSAGGHNGLKDIIQRLGTNDFNRLRIGIGQANPGRAVSHVLGGFRPDEQEEIAIAKKEAVQAIEDWMASGITEAMNRYNKKPDSK